MMRLVAALFAAALLALLPHSGTSSDRSATPRRVAWTTSRVTGSPEPPHPYRIERAFPKLTFKSPVLLVTPPGSNRWFVGEQSGRFWSFRKDEAVEKADLFCDLTKERSSWDPKGKVRGVGAAYALAFHPRFRENRYCYVCYVLDSKTQGENLPDGSRVSRFRVTDTDPPRLDLKSEKVMITWLAGGHNGCDLQFGPDGFLYISTGDGTPPNPPDGLDTGQDVSDLLSSILRIDVDREEAGRAYAVPADNPFVKTPGARPEIWSYGFRNPWRMSFDRANGDLWVGDVGWELWEMVYRIQKGGNYGWSVMEGRQQVRPNSRPGPTPILPPTIEFSHTEAASITGGYVYRGKRLPELAGAYICGDWVTRKLWATKFDGAKRVWHKEIAQGAQRVVAFGEDHDGELLFVHHDDNGTLHRLVPNEAAKAWRPTFPRRLGETGLFTSVKEQRPSPGVLPFAVNAEQWADHATAERYVALPNDAAADVYDAFRPADGFYSGQVFFPKDGVLVKTLSLEMEHGNPASRRRVETQLLHFDGTTWQGHTYAWNEEQTDADLVPAAGTDRVLEVVDRQAPGGKRRQTWHYASRTECLTCHNPWAGYTLAFTPAQLNRPCNDGTAGNQLRRFADLGLVRLWHWDGDFEERTPLAEPPSTRLTDPRDGRADLNERARSYLHVNCAHCHRFGAGGTADMELRYETSLEAGKALETRPVQGTFEIPGAQILAPGDPYRSVLYYRMAKLGGGHMPHLGSDVLDEQGLRLVHDWIRQLPLRKEERGLVARLLELDESNALAGERARLEHDKRKTSRDIARERRHAEPTADDRSEAERRVQQRWATAAKARAAERTETMRKILGSTTAALLLAKAVEEERVPAATRTAVLTASTSAPSQVRDLFERFLPPEQRTKRLGAAVRAEQILGLKGDAGRGRDLFHKSATLQCTHCHRVGTAGHEVGPDLSRIGAKLTRAQLLESILEPSKAIEPAFVSYVLESTDGRVFTGLLTKKDEREVVLKQPGGQETRVAATKVVSLAPQRTSLMPELLLRDLTREQAADLLEYLTTLK